MKTRKILSIALAAIMLLGLGASVSFASPGEINGISEPVVITGPDVFAQFNSAGEKAAILKNQYEIISNTFSAESKAAISTNRSADFMSVVSWRFDDKTQKIAVGITGLDDQKIDRFIKEMGGDRGMYDFYEQSPIVPQYTLTSGGEYNTGSVAIPTKNSATGARGFLTAAHCFNSSSQTVTAGGQTVGQVGWWAPSGYPDMAYVQLGSGHNCTVGSTGIQGTYTGNLAPGNPVTFYGKRTWNKAGTIYDISGYNVLQWSVSNGYVVSGLGTQSGDSGGALVANTAGYRLFIGLLSGSDGIYSYFVNASLPHNGMPNDTGKLAF